MDVRNCSYCFESDVISENSSKGLRGDLEVVHTPVSSSISHSNRLLVVVNVYHIASLNDCWVFLLDQVDPKVVNFQGVVEVLVHVDGQVGLEHWGVAWWLNRSHRVVK